MHASTVIRQALRWSTGRILRLRSVSTVEQKYSYADENNVIHSMTQIDPLDQNCDLFRYMTQDIQAENIASINGVTNEKTTYSQLLANANNLSHYLASSGFQKGDVFGIHTANCPEYASAVLGVLGMGGVMTTANPNYTANELTYQLKLADAKVLFTDARSLESVKKVAEECGIRRLITLDAHSSSDSDVASFASIVDRQDPGPLGVSVDLGSTAFLPFSSGTTGLPKGVCISHRAMISNMEQLRVAMHKENMNMGVLPFYHIYGLLLLVCFNTRIGRTMVTLPHFDPHAFLSAIQTHRVEKLGLVPPLVLFMLKHPLVAEYDVSSVKRIVIGAAPCKQSTVEAFLEKFPHVQSIQQGFGSTEGLVSHLVPVTEQVAGSVGKLFPSASCKISCLETGNNLGPNEEGELLVKGPQLMSGYLKNLEATAASLTDDGWYRTGDIACYDDNHNFFITDRLKELIKYKGYQVPPAELEALLVSHEDVLDAAVIGIPDEDAGELPLAFIVVKEGQDISEEDVKSFVAERLANHKRLRGGVVFLKEIPKAASGKLLRRVLKSDFLEGKLG